MDRFFCNRNRSCWVGSHFFSVDFGTSLADSWVAKQGGASTERYHIILESYIHSFLIAGSILFGFSLLFAIFTHFVFMLLPKR